MITIPKLPPRKRVESDIQNDIIVASSRIRGVRLARNNVGTLLDRRGIPVTYGLGEGSPDLVGVITFGGLNTCEPATIDEVHAALLHAHDSIALCIAIEVKQPKRYATSEQKAWHAVARKRGIESAVCRSPEEATAWIEATRDAFRLRILRIAGCL